MPIGGPVDLRRGGADAFSGVAYDRVCDCVPAGGGRGGSGDEMESRFRNGAAVQPGVLPAVGRRGQHNGGVSQGLARGSGGRTITPVLLGSLRIFWTTRSNSHSGALFLGDYL